MADIETEVKTRGQNMPYLLCCGDIVEPQHLYLILDQQILCEVQNKDAVFALLSAFFVFNVCYPKGCTNTFSFLENVILNLKNKPNPNVIRRLYLLLSVSLLFLCYILFLTFIYFAELTNVNLCVCMNA